MWRGQPIGEIPDLKSMKAEVFVLEADAAGLAVGEKATLSLEGEARHRVITGKIYAGRQAGAAAHPARAGAVLRRHDRRSITPIRR